MPQATLAAVVIVYSVGLIQPADFRDILRIRRTEFVWALAAFAGVMLLGTLKGILVAIIVSLVALVAPDRESAGLRARPQAGNERVSAALRRTPGRRVLSGSAAAAARRPAVLRQCGARCAIRFVPLMAEAKPKCRRARHERGVRSGVFRAEGADRSRAAAARFAAPRCGSRVSTPTFSRWCGARRSGMRSETNACSSIWKWPSMRFCRSAKSKQRGDR